MMLSYEVLVYSEPGELINHLFFKSRKSALDRAVRIKNDHPCFMVILQCVNSEEILWDFAIKHRNG